MQTHYVHTIRDICIIMQIKMKDGLLTKENKHASEVSDQTSSHVIKAPGAMETEKIDRLTSELEKLKVMLVK